MQHEILSDKWLEETAKKLADSRYDSQIKFFSLLKQEYETQSNNDLTKKRIQLSTHLLYLSDLMLITAKNL